MQAISGPPVFKKGKFSTTKKMKILHYFFQLFLTSSMQAISGTPLAIPVGFAAFPNELFKVDLIIMTMVMVVMMMLVTMMMMIYLSILQS